MLQITDRSLLPETASVNPFGMQGDPNTFICIVQILVRQHESKREPEILHIQEESTIASVVDICHLVKGTVGDCPLIG